MSSFPKIPDLFRPPHPLEVYSTKKGGDPVEKLRNVIDKEDMKDHLRLANKSIVEVSAEALSEIFFEGKPVTGLYFNFDRDVFEFIVADNEAENREGQMLPVSNLITTATLGEYEIHLVKKGTTEE